MPRRRFGRPGLLGTMARTAVVAGTATDAQQAAVDAAVAEALQEQAATQAAQATSVPAEAPAADDDDLLAKLERLADLKAAGVLDDAEFAAAKAQLLP